ADRSDEGVFALGAYQAIRLSRLPARALPERERAVDIEGQQRDLGPRGALSRRSYRYVAQISPVVYLCAAYLLDRLWDVPRPLPVRVGPLLCVAVVAFGLWQTPRVAEPLVDADRDGRWLLDYLHAHEGPKSVAVYTDSWRVMFIIARYGRF